RALRRWVGREGRREGARREALGPSPTERQQRRGGAAATVLNRRGQELVHVKNPVRGVLAPRRANREQVKLSLAGQEITTVQELDNGDMIQAMVPIRSGEATAAVLVVAIHVPQRLEARLRGISQAFKEYKQLKLLKNPIKGI